MYGSTGMNGRLIFHGLVFSKRALDAMCAHGRKLNRPHGPSFGLVGGTLDSIVSEVGSKFAHVVSLSHVLTNLVLFESLN